MAKPNIIPVIMSGGAGTRLWPASKKSKPKQLLSLVGSETLIQQTVNRLSGEKAGFGFLPPLIVCNQAHTNEISRQLSAISVPPLAIITEPMPRNTAPCAVIAALAASEFDQDALILLAPADHYIRDEDAFNTAIAKAIAAALDGYIVTFGITPTEPHTGYGYIKQGDVLDANICNVESFCEKPDRDTARSYLESGQYFWNAGIFMCKPSVLLQEMKLHRPDILKACQHCFSASPEKGNLRSLDARSFAACPSESIDYAVMEKTKKAAVIEANIGWSDIGSWSALRAMNAGKNGNALSGEVMVLDSKNCLVHSDGPFIAALGLEDMAVIVHEGAVLIAPFDRVQEVKKIVETLKADKRDDLL